jgi:hypothetical protein
MPESLNPDDLKNILGGRAFEGLIREALCMALDISWVHFEPGVRQTDGMPVNNGLSCQTRSNKIRPSRGVRRPDLIFGSDPVASDSSANNTWLAAEIKLRQSTFLNYKNEKKKGQLDAMLLYAKRHEYVPVAAFVSLTKGPGDKAKNARLLIRKEAIEHGVVGVIISLQNARTFNLRALF